MPRSLEQILARARFERRHVPGQGDRTLWTADAEFMEWLADQAQEIPETARRNNLDVSRPTSIDYYSAVDELRSWGIHLVAHTDEGLRPNPAQPTNLGGNMVLQVTHPGLFQRKRYEATPNPLNIPYSRRNIEQGGDLRATADMKADSPIPLRPYQKYAVRRMSDQEGTLLADDPRLGKTAQTLNVINEADGDIRRSLVVAPGTVKDNWKEEAEFWLDPKLGVRPVVVEGSEGWRAVPSEGPVLAIVHFEQLRPKTSPGGQPYHRDIHARVRDEEWDMVVLDEVQNIKNPNALQTIGILGGDYAVGTKAEIERGVGEEREAEPIRGKKRIALTGTVPVEKNPAQLYPLLRWLDPDKWGTTEEDRRAFEHRYVQFDPSARNPNWVNRTPRGSRNFQELQDLLKSGTMIRRMDTSPPAQETVVTIRPESREEWEAVQLAEAEIDEFVGEQARAEGISKDEYRSLFEARGEPIPIPITRISSLEARTSLAKAPTVAQHIIRAAEKEPVLAYTSHIGAVNRISQELDKAGVPHFAFSSQHQDPKERAELVKRFNEGERQAIISTIRAYNSGLSSGRADLVIFGGLGWRADLYRQAKSRIRMPEKDYPVRVEVLTLDRSIDANMIRRLDEKSEQERRVVGLAAGSHATRPEDVIRQQEEAEQSIYRSWAVDDEEDEAETAGMTGRVEGRPDAGRDTRAWTLFQDDDGNLQPQELTDADFAPEEQEEERLPTSYSRVLDDINARGGSAQWTSGARSRFDQLTPQQKADFRRFLQRSPRVLSGEVSLDYMDRILDDFLRDYQNYQQSTADQFMPPTYDDYLRRQEPDARHALNEQFEEHISRVEQWDDNKKSAFNDFLGANPDLPVLEQLDAFEQQYESPDLSAEPDRLQEPAPSSRRLGPAIDKLDLPPTMNAANTAIRWDDEKTQGFDLWVSDYVQQGEYQDMDSLVANFEMLWRELVGEDGVAEPGAPYGDSMPLSKLDRFRQGLQARRLRGGPVHAASQAASDLPEGAIPGDEEPVDMPVEVRGFGGGEEMSPLERFRQGLEGGRPQVDPSGELPGDEAPVDDSFTAPADVTTSFEVPPEGELPGDESPVDDMAPPSVTDDTGAPFTPVVSLNPQRDPMGGYEAPAAPDIAPMAAPDQPMGETPVDVPEQPADALYEPPQEERPAAPREEPQYEPAITDRQRQIERTDDCPLPDGDACVTLMRPDDLLTDAKTFQYKELTDESGVSVKLEDVKQWDPDLAGIAYVWERADGQRFIVDGHQRLALARRMQAMGQDPQLLVKYWKEEDGYTPRFMKLMAAKKNIAEGSGSAVDAARVLREDPNLFDTLSPSNAIVRDAKGLAKLDPAVFNETVEYINNGQLPENVASVVSRIGSDPAMQRGALLELVREQKAGRLTIGEAGELVSMARRTMLDAEGQKLQGQLEGFDVGALRESAWRERAALVEGILGDFRKTRFVLRAVGKGETKLEDLGNVLAQSANAEELDQSSTSLAIVEVLADSRGPLADFLDHQGKRIKERMDKDGISRRRAVTPFVQQSVDYLRPFLETYLQDNGEALRQDLKDKGFANITEQETFSIEGGRPGDKITRRDRTDQTAESIRSGRGVIANAPTKVIVNDLQRGAITPDEADLALIHADEETGYKYYANLTKAKELGASTEIIRHSPDAEDPKAVWSIPPAPTVPDKARNVLVDARGPNNQSERGPYPPKEINWPSTAAPARPSAPPPPDDDPIAASGGVLDEDDVAELEAPRQQLEDHLTPEQQRTFAQAQREPVPDDGGGLFMRPMTEADSLRIGAAGEDVDEEGNELTPQQSWERKYERQQAEAGPQEQIDAGLQELVESDDRPAPAEPESDSLVETAAEPAESLPAEPESDSVVETAPAEPEHRLKFGPQVANLPDGNDKRRLENTLVEMDRSWNLMNNSGVPAPDQAAEEDLYNRRMSGMEEALRTAQRQAGQEPLGSTDLQDAVDQTDTVALEDESPADVSAADTTPAELSDDTGPSMTEGQREMFQAEMEDDTPATGAGGMTDSQREMFQAELSEEEITSRSEDDSLTGAQRDMFANEVAPPGQETQEDVQQREAMEKFLEEPEHPPIEMEGPVAQGLWSPPEPEEEEEKADSQQEGESESADETESEPDPHLQEGRADDSGAAFDEAMDRAEEAAESGDKEGQAQAESDVAAVLAQEQQQKSREPSGKTISVPKVLDQLSPMPEAEEGSGLTRLRALMNARDFVTSSDNPEQVKFRFSGSRQWNHVQFTLAPDDTYTVQFFRIGRNVANMKVGDELKGVEAEQLPELFERETGLMVNTSKSFRASPEKGKQDDKGLLPGVSQEEYAKALEDDAPMAPLVNKTAPTGQEQTGETAQPEEPGAEPAQEQQEPAAAESTPEVPPEATVQTAPRRRRAAVPESTGYLEEPTPERQKVRRQMERTQLEYLAAEKAGNKELADKLDRRCDSLEMRLFDLGSTFAREDVKCGDDDDSATERPQVPETATVREEGGQYDGDSSVKTKNHKGGRTPSHLKGKSGYTPRPARTGGRMPFEIKSFAKQARRN